MDYSEWFTDPDEWVLGNGVWDDENEFKTDNTKHTDNIDIYYYYSSLILDDDKISDNILDFNIDYYTSIAKDDFKKYQNKFEEEIFDDEISITTYLKDGEEPTNELKLLMRKKLYDLSLKVLASRQLSLNNQKKKINNIFKSESRKSKLKKIIKNG